MLFWVSCELLALLCRGVRFQFVLCQLSRVRDGGGFNYNGERQSQRHSTLHIVLWHCLVRGPAPVLAQRIINKVNKSLIFGNFMRLLNRKRTFKSPVCCMNLSSKNDGTHLRADGTKINYSTSAIKHKHKIESFSVVKNGILIVHFGCDRTEENTINIQNRWCYLTGSPFSMREINNPNVGTRWDIIGPFASIVCQSWKEEEEKKRRKALVSARPKILKQLSGRVGLELKFKKVLVKSHHTQKSRKHRKCFSVELMNAKKNGESEWAGCGVEDRKANKQISVFTSDKTNYLQPISAYGWRNR